MLVPLNRSNIYFIEQNFLPCDIHIIDALLRIQHTMFILCHFMLLVGHNNKVILPVDPGKYLSQSGTWPYS